MTRVTRETPQTKVIRIKHDSSFKTIEGKFLFSVLFPWRYCTAVSTAILDRVYLHCFMQQKLGRLIIRWFKQVLYDCSRSCGLLSSNKYHSSLLFYRVFKKTNYSIIRTRVVCFISQLILNHETNTQKKTSLLTALVCKEPRSHT